jgi:Glucose / Sorbosone dehydrogenase
MKLAIALIAAAILQAAPDLTIELRDYLQLPMTGHVDGKGQIQGLLARVNFIREEPGPDRHRWFINDLNGPLYIFDKQTKTITTYLDLHSIFHRLPIDLGFANGFITFAFDPDYAHNGKFYTVHLENPALPAAPDPDNSQFPHLSLAGYSITQPITPPGDTIREAVLIEWTDSNPSNTTFEGAARELMRVRYNGYAHPMGDLIFNPNARPGDPDYRVLYIASGDGASGESRNPEMRSNPQRLDTLVGKILRIIPDLNEKKSTSAVSPNGRYRIPNDNPFASTPGARAEIWAYGLRNPARLDWEDDHLIASVIGLYTWETVDIIHKGANYGYSAREGNQKLESTNHTAALPSDDRLPIMLNANSTIGMIAPTYPVIEYPHDKSGGDAMSSGYVYRGKSIPALNGKYLFGDISTGNLWWSNYKEMLAADDANPQTLAEMHPIKIKFNGETYASMSPITERAYHARGGKAEHLPGTAKVAENGRADIHLWSDSHGDLYVFSKSDGMIRQVTAAYTNAK